MYYQFNLHKNKNNPYWHTQHKLLINLSHLKGVRAYYCSPRFHTFDKLWAYFQNGNVASNSAWIDCNHLKLIELTEDKKNHRLLYSPVLNNKIHFLCSDIVEYDNYNIDYETHIKFLSDDVKIDSIDYCQHVTKLYYDCLIDNNSYDKLCQLLKNGDLEHNTKLYIAANLLYEFANIDTIFLLENNS